MNIQEAYNKGLTDAEEKVITAIKQVLYLEKPEKFLNPELQHWFELLSNEYTILKNDAINKIGSDEPVAQQPIPEQEQLPLALESEESQTWEETKEKIDNRAFVFGLVKVLVEGKKMDYDYRKDHENIIDIVKIRSDAYVSQFDTRTNAGKQRKKELKEQELLLTGEQ